MKVTYRKTIGKMVANTLIALLFGAIGVDGMFFDRGLTERLFAIVFMFPLSAFLFAHVFDKLTVEPGAISIRSMMRTRRYESGNVRVSIDVEKRVVWWTRFWLVATDSRGQSSEMFLVNDVGRRKRVKLLVDVSAALDRRIGGLRLIPWWPSSD